MGESQIRLSRNTQRNKRKQSKTIWNISGYKQSKDKENGFKFKITENMNEIYKWLEENDYIPPEQLEDVYKLFFDQIKNAAQEHIGKIQINHNHHITRKEKNIRN